MENNRLFPFTIKYKTIEMTADVAVESSPEKEFSVWADSLNNAIEILRNSLDRGSLEKDPLNMNDGKKAFFITDVRPNVEEMTTFKVLYDISYIDNILREFFGCSVEKFKNNFSSVILHIWLFIFVAISSILFTEGKLFFGICGAALILSVSNSLRLIISLFFAKSRRNESISFSAIVALPVILTMTVYFLINKIGG
jgi:hypothetical protein